MSGWTLAGLAGLLVGSALFIGALLGWFVRSGHQTVAAVMAFGAGVLIAVVSFDLLESAYRVGGLGTAIFSFVAGAAALGGVNV